MKSVIQRCFSADVKVDGASVGKIGKGLLVLLGVGESDSEADVEILAEKTASLRIFSDENDKMNLSVKDVKGEILVVSNFTLCADTKKGTRPSFSKAMEPTEAKRLYKLYCDNLRNMGITVNTGVFGADMNIELSADGPVTIIHDTAIWLNKQ